MDNPSNLQRRYRCQRCNLGMVALNGGYSLEASAEHKCRTSVQVHTGNVELDSNELIIMNQNNLLK